LPTTSGTLVVTGGAQTIEFADGTVSAPSITNSGDTNTGIYFPAADTIAFTEGGVESMRIDSSGNVIVGGASAILSSAGRGNITVNGSSSAIYTLGIGGAERGYLYVDGSSVALSSSTTIPLVFQTNGSERMAINSSGNVGIGTSSPAARLDVLSPSNQVITNLGHPSTSTEANNGGALLRIQNTSNTNGNMESLIFANANASATSAIFGYNTNQSTNEGFMTFGTRNSGGTFGERMRISSSGDLFLNTTGYNNGKIVRYDTSDSRIRSMIVVNDSAGSSSRCGYIVNAFGNSWAMEMGSAAANSNSLNWTVDIFGTPTVRMALTTAGAATNSTGTWGTISDIRLKENVVDATPKLDNLMKLRVVNYNLKTDPDIKMLGFVAQELEQVFPNLVGNDGDPTEDGDNYKSVKTTVLIPMLIKAMQEQQAIITQLQADVAALKGAK
jgi:hypothetical protein